MGSGINFYSSVGSVCSPLSQSQEVSVTLSSASPIRFFGKGAGADMMLSSSAGRLSVAIGEGTPKFIQKAMAKPAVH